MRLNLFDFRSPTPFTGEQSRRLDQWFNTAAQRSVEAWGSVLSFPAQMKPRRQEWTTAAEWLAELPPEVIGFRTTLGRADVHSLVVLPRALVLALLAGALGEQAQEPPTDRELTFVEESLSSYLVRVLMVDLLSRAWPGSGTLTVEIQQREPEVRWSRVFGLGEKVLLCTFLVMTPFGELDWCWLLPRSSWLKDLTGTARQATRPGHALDPALEATVRQLPVEISVSLGSAEVSLSQVERFQPGDLILLDQRVEQSLLALVSGEGKFRVTPGAVGPRQAVRIEAIVEQ
jgi:flagellar motor switch protein FliM